MQYANDELKIIGISGHIWIRMLEEKQKVVLDKLYGKYKSGIHDFLTDIAEYVVIREQIAEVTQAIKKQQRGE